MTTLIKYINSYQILHLEQIKQLKDLNGEFDRFIIRLENKIKDKRLSFIMNTLKDDGHPYVTSDLNI